MDTAKTAHWLTLFLLATGCFGAHGDSGGSSPRDAALEDLGPAPDLGPSDLGRPPDLGSPNPAVDGGPVVRGDTACFIGSPTDQVRLTPAEADCLTLTNDDCAGCHQGSAGWVLRPETAPPPGVIDPIDITACIEPCRLLPFCAQPEWGAAQLLEGSCGSGACHEGSNPSSALDLVAPGVFERMVDATSEQCDGWPLIDQESPGDSYFLAKTAGTVPTGCGDRMPPFGFLDSSQTACLERWITESLDGR